MYPGKSFPYFYAYPKQGGGSDRTLAVANYLWIFDTDKRLGRNDIGIIILFGYLPTYIFQHVAQ